MSPNPPIHTEPQASGILSLDGGDLRPWMTEAEFLASVAGQRFKPLVKGPKHRSYVCLDAGLGERKCSVTAYFLDGRLSRVDLSLHASVALSADWQARAWEEAYLVELKQQHVLWLGELLCMAPVEVLGLPWGKMEAYMDLRAWGAGIVVSYAATQP